MATKMSSTRHNGQDSASRRAPAPTSPLAEEVQSPQTIKKTRLRKAKAVNAVEPAVATTKPKPRKAARAKADRPAPPAATEPKTAKAPPAAPAAAATNPLESLMLLSPAQREGLESMSRNLARAALTAQSAIAEAALRQADRPAALSPDPFHLGPALSEVLGGLAAQPDRMIRAQADLLSQYMELWRSAAHRLTGQSGEPAVKPDKSDKRFADDDWSANPVFDVMKQSYLLTANWLNNLVANVEGVDPIANRRVEFFMKMLTDAFSPSNFLMSNPVALREIAATHGESLVRGMENFAADLQRGEGQLQISQTDSSLFKVGENVATAPGKVIFQNELIQLLQFSPSTEQVREVPLLIFPPWINKFYILDLRPENSMIRWLVGQGFTVFVASWVNPDGRLANKTFEDYLFEGVYAATEAVRRQCGVKQVNTVGYCIGGTLLSCALAYMAAKGDEQIASATFFAAQQDFSDAGDLKLFTQEDWISDVEKQMDASGGVLSGKAMGDTFNALRANDLIWSFFVNNYLLGKEPRPFDLLFWNSDQTRMPKVLHLFYLRQFYRDNKLAKGELEIAGEQLDMGKIKIPVFVQSSKEDHIAPSASVYRGARLFGGPTTFMMAGSGHIAGVINPPAAHKYQHWVNDQLPETVEAWMSGAREAPGSWWPDWAQWLTARSGGMTPARDPSNGPLKPIEDAPGSFVEVRS